MILLFGGTTEGKRASSILDDLKLPYLYSTKTPPSYTPSSPFARSRQGPLDEAGLRKLCKEEGIRIILDAAHPFASELHNTVHTVATELELPAIRYERSPLSDSEEEDGVHSVKDYKEAIAQLEKLGIDRLLALTGVQSIAPLRPFWQKHPTWFRILPRQSSLEEAKENGLDPERSIQAYPPSDVEEELALIRKYGIQGILTKASGGPGGFATKKEAARKSGIPLLVLERPSLPSSFIVRTDEESLRKALEEAAKTQKLLRYGYSTGTCAAAATRAALSLLLSGERLETVHIELPDGGIAALPVEGAKEEGESCSAIVVKDAGDDPDATHGARIGARVRMNGKEKLRFFRGEGVGEVTLEGIGLPVGEPAINPVPRRMIEKTVQELLQETEGQEGVDVTLFVEDGERIAQKTLNERVGIRGGISILGTSGIVTPYSKASYIASIEQGIEIALRSGCRELVLNSGGRSEKILQQEAPHLPDQAFIQYGNWIGETLEKIESTEVQKVRLGIMLGKAVKLAEGYLDTSSRQGSMNSEFLVRLTEEAHPDQKELSVKIRELSMAGRLTELFPFEKDEPFFQKLAARCAETCRRVLSPDKELSLGLIEKDGGVLWFEG